MFLFLSIFGTISLISDLQLLMQDGMAYLVNFVMMLLILTGEVFDNFFMTMLCIISNIEIVLYFYFSELVANEVVIVTDH